MVTPREKQMNNIVHMAIVVNDYDEAIEYYTKILNFCLLEDKDMGAGKRWVRVAPSANAAFSLLLAKAKNDHQQKYVGDQTGGRVFIFYHVDDFWAEYNRMQQLGVDFTEQPREEDYATVVVFRDLYGNKWDMIQPR
ncbi:MAG: VOC family protein [Rhizobiales bacterium]|nr:VOC family protein [Hyphomicrobiales bacterium]